ncbi:MAG: hypothetical protein M1830_008321 [Pleopsidium flavum]|nr:MAG: hypothetical protein M1830_008321 [Pleopsidium flavum]
MNQTSTPSWSQIAHHDPMVSAPEDDFASFLEFGDLQLNYGNYEVTTQDGQGVSHDSGNVMDTTMENAGGPNGLGEGHIQHQQVEHDGIQQSDLPSMEDMTGSTDSLMDLNIQAQIFHQQQQHQQMQSQTFHRQAIIPPTPNSMKMHGGTGHYYPQMDSQAQAIYERYSRMKEDQMVFTPLVSPAVTPLDTQFRIPEYTIPGEYFSPLTSPALEAQNAAAHRSVYGTARSETSIGTSPIDMSLDMGASPASSMTPLRKSRRKAPAATSRNPRTVLQSPAMKPQSRRKQPSSTVIPPKEVAEIMEDARNLKATSTNTGTLPVPYTQDSSEAESISPEPLSEALMPPPATPRSGSAGKSPYLTAQHVGSRSAPLLPMTNEPATPASLMKLRKQANRTGSMRQEEREGDLEIVEDITLPEAATSRPFLPPINTAQANDDQTTPTLSARRTPKLGPTSAPLSTSSSIMPSPQFRALASPTGSVARRMDSKPTGRASKKRNSTSSVHVSPALRPKISPSIKPLLPEGATVNAETSALLLASKSNYQNILEGTHLPGVSYPEALSTNLTSKRTSHKIAEQGRRNRINNALQEIASLLPASPTAGNSGREGSGSGSGGDGGITTGTAAQQSNSKASTVEMAIDYIKALQKELAETKTRLDVAEKKLVER